MLSGNRNFEGRIHPEVKMNYLASPPLVVAYALAGRMDLDLLERAARPGQRTARTSTCKDIWPTQREIHELIESSVKSEMFKDSYGDTLFEGDEEWQAVEVPEGDRYTWDEDSTYVKRPPYFDDMPEDAPEGFEQIEGARVLVMLGDSVTTDHISPAGAIKEDSPAGRYLKEHGIEKQGLQLLRLPARQPRGDDARHVRQRAAAQPARAGHRGQRDAAPARTRRRCRSSTPP